MINSNEEVNSNEVFTSTYEVKISDTFRPSIYPYKYSYKILQFLVYCFLTNYFLEKLLGNSQNVIYKEQYLCIINL